MVSNKTYEKVSFNLPIELKNELLKLKKEMKVSLNSIYKKAITEYIEREEIKRWEKAAILASKDEEYQKLCKELSNTIGD